MPHQPVQVYALEIPAGDVPVPAFVEDLPANLRITMAALDPSAPAQLDLAPAGQTIPRATLKIIKIANDQDDDDDEDDEDYDSDDIAALEARLKPVLGDSDDDSEEDDSEVDSEEENGGPSDPEKSKQARKDAAVKALLESLKNDDEMDTDDLPNGVNGIKGNKGKARASDDDESDLEDDDEGELEEYVICTLDITQHYQQPIDITINEGEQVFFKVTGTHSVYLTGNYIADVHSDSDSEDDEDDEMDYYGEGLEDDSDDLDEELDDLDDLSDPRITEVDSEEEAPKLVKASKKAEKKGKNKRPAEDSEEEPSTLDALISKSLKPAEAATNGEKLSKKQAKKLKNNQGVAVAGAEEKEINGTNGTPTSTKSDKKVQFAKNLEQGPTGSPLPKADAKAGAKKDDAASPKSALGVKMVQGVKIDDKKVGKGPAAKKGDKVGMRYIGKLENGKIFDSNKKGKPFQFGLGKGEVISGWDIGVAGMTVGGERRLTIPAKLAYGAKGVPGIPGNSTLIFDVKLITIN